MSEATATHVEPQFEEAEQQREAATMGMWLFLATEVLLFGGMFLGYTVYRISYPEAFAEASRHTLVAFGAVNTAVLLISSAVMAFAVRAARANRRGLSGFLLLLTAFLGALFLATEVLLFGGMFLGYTVYRASYPEAFAEASRHTLIAFGAVNTAILLISSTVMAFAVRATRANRRGLSGFVLLIPAVLGALLLVI